MLPAEVRLKLVDFMGSVYAADRKGSWAFLEQRRARVAPLSVHQALVKMVNDEDHAVRMRIGEVIISLYISKCPGLDDVLTPTMSLVHQKMQQEIFAQVMESLQLAYFIPDGLHDLSSEDESVNRVSSRVYTLQLMACVSPLCERKVVSELVLAVKLGHIETDLVEKVWEVENTAAHILLLFISSELLIMVVDLEFGPGGPVFGLQRNQRTSGVYVAFPGSGLALKELHYY